MQNTRLIFFSEHSFQFFFFEADSESFIGLGYDAPKNGYKSRTERGRPREMTFLSSMKFEHLDDPFGLI